MRIHRPIAILILFSMFFCAPSISHALAAPVFQRPLSLGSVGEDVRMLQIALNSDPNTQVAVSGPGSPGQESIYFGMKTFLAVKTFQAQNTQEVLAPLGLKAGTGYVGRLSIEKLNKNVASGVVPRLESASAGNTYVPPTAVGAFQYGMISTSTGIARVSDRVAVVQSAPVFAGGGGGGSVSVPAPVAASPAPAAVSAPTPAIAPSVIPPVTPPATSIITPPATTPASPVAPSVQTPPPAPTRIPVPTPSQILTPEAGSSGSIAGLTVGNREVVIDNIALTQLGLTAWPDGFMGVQKAGSQYTFFTANSSSVARTVGTLDNPAAGGVQTTQIQNMKRSYNYVSGGPVYKDPNSSDLLMIYHAERWIGGDPKTFWSLLGMARSTDNGNTWKDLGEIITPQMPFASNVVHEIGGGSFLIIGDYMYVYFRDTVKNGSSNKNINLAVAGARVSDILSAARNGTTTIWMKYHNGAWNESALGGYSSPLDPNNQGIGFSSVSKNTYLGKYILVASAGNNWDLGMMESSDGINWRSMTTLETETGESYVPTIIGIGSDPAVTGRQFYVYYTFSNPGGWARWNTSVLARRMITFAGSTPAPVVASPAPSVTAPPAVPATNYRASVDFSGTQGSQNWSYLDSTGAQLTYDAVGNRWQGSETYLRIGPSWQHPGGGPGAVRRWTAPSAGAVRIAGSAADSDTGGGDGVAVAIHHNSAVLWQATIDNGAPSQSFDVRASVAAGDHIDFVTLKRENNYFDSTTFTPLIVFTPGSIAIPQQLEIQYSQAASALDAFMQMMRVILRIR